MPPARISNLSPNSDAEEMRSFRLLTSSPKLTYTKYQSVVSLILIALLRMSGDRCHVETHRGAYGPHPTADVPAFVIHWN
jgi:hypothetical protein